MEHYNLARRAQVDFNATDAHPAYSHLNESSIAVLRDDANRIFSPVQVDGFSVSILVALFGMYLLSLTSKIFMRVFMRIRYLASPSVTQRQCANFLASAITMSVPAPLLGYALSAAKWDINMMQIRCVRLAAILICSFALYDLIHRQRTSVVIFFKRTISLGVVSLQIYMFNQTQDPSFIITLVALLFVSMTEAPAFFGLFLYKLQVSARFTKFILRSAVGSTIFVKAAGVAVGVYTWTKFQRQDMSILGRVSSVIYLAALVGLLTCQVLMAISLHKLAKEVDERYAKKGPLELPSSKAGGGGRSKGRNTPKAGNGHWQGENGELRRHQDDRLSTFDLTNMARNSLEMDEKRHSGMGGSTSYKSMDPDNFGTDEEWQPPTIRERLRALSPLGRKSPNFSRPLNGKKKAEAAAQRRSAVESYYETQGASTSKQGAQSPSTFGSRYSSEMKNVPVLSFDGPEGRPRSAATNFGSERSGEASYASPPTTRRILEDNSGGHLYLRGDEQPQIVVSAASSLADHSTLNDHNYASAHGTHAAGSQDDAWNRSHSQNGGSSSNGSNSRQVGVNRITGFTPHQLSSGMNATDETSRYALGIVQEYIEPSDSSDSSQWGRNGDGASSNGRQSASDDRRGNSTTPLTPDLDHGSHTYTVPRHGSRPRQTPNSPAVSDQDQYYAQQSYQSQQEQHQQQQRYQYEGGSSPSYSYAFDNRTHTNNSASQQPQFLADL